jgi:YidC/Oxa1 family membrane protein insertase
VGVIDERLQEQKYDDIKEKNEKYQGTEGWVGITDKYWLTAIVPQKKRGLQCRIYL